MSKELQASKEFHDWSLLKEQVGIAIKTGFLPSSIKTPEQALTIALKGRELGIPPLHALSHIHVIQGKPCISSELMLALIFKNCPNAIIFYTHSDAKGCEISAKRGPNQVESKFSFLEADARLAGALTKDTWKKHPAAMYRARCISAMARALFPDAIMGCSYVPEEMGATVNEDGHVVDIPETVTIQNRYPDKEEATQLELGENHEHELGKFIIPYGPMKGQMLEDIEFEKLVEYANYYKDSKRPPMGAALITLQAVQGYLEEGK